jgi:hypothetical protein
MTGYLTLLPFVNCPTPSDRLGFGRRGGEAKSPLDRAGIGALAFNIVLDGARGDKGPAARVLLERGEVSQGD